MAPDEPDISPYAGLLGVEWLSQDPDDAKARVEWREDLTQPYGYLHGGVIMGVIDEMCSRCTVIQVIMDGMVALGQSQEISLIRSVREGGITISARIRHRGSSTWVWDAEATDDEGRLCALSKVTIAVRPYES